MLPWTKERCICKFINNNQHFQEESLARTEERLTTLNVEKKQHYEIPSYGLFSICILLNIISSLICSLGGHLIICRCYFPIIQILRLHHWWLMLVVDGCYLLCVDGCHYFLMFWFVNMVFICCWWLSLPLLVINVLWSNCKSRCVLLLWCSLFFLPMMAVVVDCCWSSLMLVIHCWWLLSIFNRYWCHWLLSLGLLVAIGVDWCWCLW